jgi:DNA adenine methylase
VLSGYSHALYDDALQGWERRDRVDLADGARKRTEVLWINPAAAERVNVHLAGFLQTVENQ